MARISIAAGALAAGFSLAGLATATTVHAYTERTANYRCGGAYGFSVIYEKTGSLLVMIAGGAYRLRSRGDGAWADGRGQKLVVNARGAVWTSVADGVRHCRIAARREAQ